MKFNKIIKPFLLIECEIGYSHSVLRASLANYRLISIAHSWNNVEYSYKFKGYNPHKDGNGTRGNKGMI